MKIQHLVGAILCMFTAVQTGAQNRNAPFDKRASDQIRAAAREKVKAFNDLLNALSNNDLNDYDRKYLILNSYMPSNDQIFFNDGVVIEDDTDPSASGSGTDTPIEKYLNNIDLFYQKETRNTVTFSNSVVSEVKQGERYPYVKVFYTSTFGGRHKTLGVPYRPAQRIAELMATRVDDEWLVYITRVAYATEESIASTDAPKVPIASANSGEIPLAVKTNAAPEIPGIQTNASVQKRNGLIRIGVGIAAIAFGAVTYSMLSKDHKDYKNRISNPEGITSYASPGIYISGGAAAAGLAISLSSLPNFRKAGK